MSWQQQEAHSSRLALEAGLKTDSLLSPDSVCASGQQKEEAAATAATWLRRGCLAGRALLCPPRPLPTTPPILGRDWILALTFSFLRGSHSRHAGAELLRWHLESPALLPGASQGCNTQPAAALPQSASAASMGLPLTRLLLQLAASSAQQASARQAGERGHKKHVCPKSCPTEPPSDLAAPPAAAPLTRATPEPRARRAPHSHVPCCWSSPWSPSAGNARPARPCLCTALCTPGT